LNIVREAEGCIFNQESKGRKKEREMRVTYWREKKRENRPCLEGKKVACLIQRTKK